MKETLKIVQIGLGNRGTGLLKLILDTMEDIQIVGVCDVYADRADSAAALIAEKQGIRPAVTNHYHELLTLAGVDAVFITSAWEQHIEIACTAMEAGIPAACEVGGAYAIEDCWKLVTREKRIHWQRCSSARAMW